MVLSKRERYIAIGLLAAIGLFAADRIIFTPLLDWSDQLRKDQADIQDQNDTYYRSAHKQGALRKLWTQMVTDGLKPSADDAEAQMNNALLDWSRDAGVALASLSNERKPADKNGFVAILFHVTADGTTNSISKFLWRIETAKIPTRLESMHISSHKEGNDDLQVQMNLSTLCNPPQADKPAPANNPQSVTSSWYEQR